MNIGKAKTCERPREIVTMNSDFLAKTYFVTPGFKLSEVHPLRSGCLKIVDSLD